MSEYRYCESWDQRIAEEVCDKRLGDGRCKRDRHGKCHPVRTVNISDGERARRSERMKILKRGGDKDGED